MSGNLCPYFWTLPLIWGSSIIRDQILISRSFQRHKPPRCPSATLHAACEVSEDDNMILGRHKILFSVGVVGQLGTPQFINRRYFVTSKCSIGKVASSGLALLIIRSKATWSVALWIVLQATIMIIFNIILMIFIIMMVIIIFMPVEMFAGRWSSPPLCQTQVSRPTDCT